MDGEIGYRFLSRKCSVGSAAWQMWPTKLEMMIPASQTGAYMAGRDQEIKRGIVNVGMENWWNLRRVVRDLAWLHFKISEGIEGRNELTRHPWLPVLPTAQCYDLWNDRNLFSQLEIGEVSSLQPRKHGEIRSSVWGLTCKSPLRASKFDLGQCSCGPKVLNKFGCNICGDPLELWGCL